MLRTRGLSAILIVAPLLIAIALGTWALAILLAVVAAIAAGEAFRLLKAAGFPSLALFGAVLAVAFVLEAYWRPVGDKGLLLVAIGAVLAFVWTVAYFTFFWSATGQTPGNRVMRIRVEDAVSGETIRMRRAFLRFFGLLLSALLLCIGFLMILVDRRRRALHDRLLRTAVVYVPENLPPARRGLSPARPVADVDHAA